MPVPDKPRSHERLIEPDGAKVLVALPDQYAEHRATASQVLKLHVLDHSANADRPILFQVLELDEFTKPLVVAGKKEQHVSG